MKKISVKLVLLVLIIIAINLFVVSYDSKSLNQRVFDEEHLEKKDETWELIKNEVYRQGKNKDNQFLKYTGPILFNLHNATKKDSLAFNNVMQELQDLLPNKEINHLSLYTKKRSKDNEKKSDSIINGYPLRFLKLYSINFNFHHDDFIIEHEFNKKHELPEAIVFDKGEPYHFNVMSNSSVTKDIGGFINQKTHLGFTSNVSISKRARVIKNIIFKLLAFKSFYVSDDYTNVNVSVLDEQVLQKFYSQNFWEEFEAYMNKTYGWRYTNYFLDKEKAKKDAVLIVSSIGFIAFLLIFSFFYKRKFNHTFLNYFYPILFILLYQSQLHSVYNHLINFDTIRRPLSQILSLIILSPLTALIVSSLLWKTERIFIKNEMGFTIKLILKVALTFLAFSAPIITIYFLKGNYENIYNFFLPEIYFWFALALGRGVLIYLSNFSENLIKQKDLELSQLKEINSQAEVKLLQSQINPHFLYNALNSIASLAHKNADKTEKMALSLSDLFKYTINRKGKKDSTIGDEVEMVKNYLEVEQIRFDDRLNFTIDVDKSLENTKFPMYLIQPLIENAVKHGISKVEKNGLITLCIQKDNGGFLIIVEDNGPDFPDGLVSGHGLQTVFDLLRLTYKDKASISWKNKPTKHIKITIENEQTQ